MTRADTEGKEGVTTFRCEPAYCLHVWITSVYYDFGRNDADLRTGGWGDWYYSLLSFPLRDLPTSAIKAVLRLYQYTAPQGGTPDGLLVDRVTSPWNNFTRWPQRPQAVNILSLPTPVNDEWLEIDITEQFNAWQRGAYPNYGIQLRTVSNDNHFNTFRSPQFEDPTYRPQIVVTTASPDRRRF